MGAEKVISGFFLNFVVFISIFNVGPVWKPSIFSEANCIMYGECGSYNENPLKILNCYYNGPPKPATKKIISTLEKWCPHYFDKGFRCRKEKNMKTCCDETQIKKFETQVVNLAMLVKRCPSCQYNFIEHICEFTCRPDQSSFIEVVNTTKTSTGQKGVSEINIYMSKSYAYKTYDSCKGLILPLANQHVMDILCNRPVQSCTPELWFSFIGDANAFSPFQINYKMADKKFNKYELLNIKTFGCNEKPLENSTTCSCIDCLESCPSAKPSNLKPSLYVGAIRLAHFLIIWFFIIGEGIIIFLLVFYWRKEKMALLQQGTTNPDILSTVCLKIRRSCRKMELLSAKMEKSMEISFRKLGHSCASYPWIFVSGVFIVFIGFSMGITFIRITTDPIELWANPTSQSRLDKDYFDSHFDPFYRTEQIIIKAVNLPDIFYNDSTKIIQFGPVFHNFFLLKVYELQKSILQVSAGGKTLKDLCTSFLTDSGMAGNASDCAIQSVWGYFQDDPSTVTQNSDEYLGHILTCMNNPYLPNECLAPWGGPIIPDLAFGGFLKDGLDKNKKPQYEKANVLILTYLLKNDLNKMNLKPATNWETEFIKLIQSWSKGGPDYMKISFKSEISVEDELAKDSHSDAFTILISYIVMFIYIIIFLGKCTSWKRLFVDSRIVLGFLGLILVLMSVSSSIGFFGYVGLPATPIIVEVIPFLVLAIGVDNIFIIVQTYDRLEVKPNETTRDRVSRMMGIVGPSVTLCSLSECCCFFVGGLSDMPAVRAFALYAGTALLLAFIFQITCFVSLLALDGKRLSANRYDVLCCVKSKAVRLHYNDALLICFKKFYVPVLMNRYTRPIIIVLFFGFFCLSMASFPVIEVGFPQEYSMSKDSYLYKYFKDLKEYLSIGPPVYFVIKDSPLNYSLPKVQNMLCSGSHCDSDSFTSWIYQASQASEETYIATPATSWIDDYFDWSSYGVCCKMYENKTFCPHSDYDCDNCEREPPQADRPSKGDFERYISFFLRDNPDASCGKGGHPSYGGAVKLKSLGVDSKGFERHAVGANYFMAYHNILRSSEDYYRALDSALKLSNDMKNTLNSKISKLGYDFTVNVFPYSVFYVYYEQYLSVKENAVKGILLSFSAIFIVTFLLLGLDFWSSCLVVSTIAMIITDIVGIMYLWNVQLNAISLVNLVLGVGISVEFCSHFTHYFIKTTGPDRVYRASVSLSEMGSSVFAGITITKFIGISVLAFAKSQIFQVFYFRMFFTIVLTAAAHGLIYLPVLLSYIGSDTHLLFIEDKDKDKDKGSARGSVSREADTSTEKDKSMRGSIIKEYSKNEEGRDRRIPSSPSKS